MALAWKFGICDLAGVNIGEVQNAYDRSLSLPLNGLPTASFRIRLDDPLADEIITRNGDCLLKVYQDVGCRVVGSLGATGNVTVNSTAGFPSVGWLMIDSERITYTGVTATTFTGCTRGTNGTTAATHADGTPIVPLRFIGDITTVEEGGPAQSGEGASVTVTAAGPLWRLGKRLLGIPYPGVNPTWTGVAAQVIIRNILDQLNANSDTGIREGTFATLYATDYGPAYLKPAKEALEEIQAAKVPPPVGTPAVYTARDDFTQVGTGNPPELLHLLPASGDATQWDCDDVAVGLGLLVYDTDLVHRSAGSDSSYSTGGWAISGTGTHGSVLVGIDYQHGVGYSSGYDVYSGVVARYVDQNHWLLAYISLGDNTLRLRKKNGVGTDAEWHTFAFSPGGIAASTRYAIRLLVDDDGNYAVWHWAPGSGSAGSPHIYGQDSTLSSTGALATGKVGFYDAMTTAVAADRGYYNFFAQADPSPQSFDFEIAPVEPTADASGYPGTLPYIGTMNISYQIGTSKPEVIFEYGDGNRSSKSYKRSLSREGLVNIAYVLPTDFEGGVTTQGELALSSDQASIDARTAFEEVVPADFDNFLLRNALAAAHTRVRKIPRQLITFEPSDEAPEFGTDYIVGDFITGRAKVNGEVRFNALFRVYGVEITVDDEGKANVVPSLVPA